MVAGEALVTNDYLDKRDCNVTNSTVDVQYAINLAALTAFYDLANATLTGSLLTPMDELEKAQPLKLPFFGDDINKFLAADDAASYSLKRISDSLENDSVI
ncbi:MAG TPA: hypothetical protein VLS45_05630, partial [Methylomicrobium sp.]|nr:hypothetical protein [Methylomicrobium sp.]